MIVTRQEMIQCEKDSNLTESELMEMAGCRCADALMKEIDKEDHVLILCGKGNNGGDGFVIGRILMQNQYHVQLYLCENTISSETARYMAEQLNPELFVKDDILNTIHNSDVIIDCIYGFSFRGQIKEEMIPVFDAVNQSKARVYSIDLNSGMEADTAKADPHTIISDMTFVLGHYKIAHLFQKDHHCFKALKQIPLDIPLLLQPSIMEMNESEFKKYYPVKAIDSYKNINGRTLCIAGSKNMAGAAILCAMAAWKTGIGYLHLVSEESVLYPIIQKFPVTLTHTIEELSSLLHRVDSIVIGCGCDRLSDFKNIFLTLLNHSEVPCVVDAYGLRILADHLHVLKNLKCQMILTPHLGEFSALTKISVNDIVKDKVNIAQKFAKEHGIILVLKGPNTLVVSPEGRIYVNQTGHQNLAKAGSGDVLAGLIAGFCAQNLDPFVASCMAVWLHGAAADCSVVPDPVFSAMDLLDGLNEVYRKIN